MNKTTNTASSVVQPRQRRSAFSIFVIVFVSLTFSVVTINILGYIYGWGWVGVNDPQTGEIKTFWDWMELGLIPIVLAMGAYLLTESAKAHEHKLAEQRRESEHSIADQRAVIEQGIAKDGQRQTALEVYYDRMTELLLGNGLRASNDGDEVRSIARTRTLTILRELDGKRRGQVLQFLYELNLINGDKPIIDMTHADLREIDLPFAKLEGVALPGANLRKANLYMAKLQGANFEMADLDEANLSWADLQRANLHCGLSNAILGVAKLDGAILFRANLCGADMINASMIGADLRYANFRYKNALFGELGSGNVAPANLALADLSQCNLTGAKITPQQLIGARSLTDAIMPNEMRFEDWRESLKGTDIKEWPAQFD